MWSASAGPVLPISDWIEHPIPTATVALVAPEVRMNIIVSVFRNRDVLRAAFALVISVVLAAVRQTFST